MERIESNFISPVSITAKDIDKLRKTQKKIESKLNEVREKIHKLEQPYSSIPNIIKKNLPESAAKTLDKIDTQTPKILKPEEQAKMALLTQNYNSLSRQLEQISNRLELLTFFPHKSPISWARALQTYPAAPEAVNVVIQGLNVPKQFIKDFARQELFINGVKATTIEEVVDLLIKVAGREGASLLLSYADQTVANFLFATLHNTGIFAKNNLIVGQDTDNVLINIWSDDKNNVYLQGEKGFLVYTSDNLEQPVRAIKGSVRITNIFNRDPTIQDGYAEFRVFRPNA